MSNFLTTVVIAVLTAWVTVQFSLHRFRTERWWDRKIDAYSKIIEALYNAKREPEELIGADIDGREVPEERKKELESNYKEAQKELSKAVGVGEFFLSKTATHRLKIYFGEHEKAKEHQMWFEHLEADWKAAADCLKDMIEIAKNDLGGHTPWYKGPINGLKCAIEAKCKGWTGKKKSP